MLFKKFSIKFQIFLLLAIVMIIVPVSYFLPYELSEGILEDKISGSVLRIIGQVDENVQSFYRDMEGISNSLIYNNTIQKYLSTDNIIERFDMEKDIEKVFLNTKLMKDSIRGISIYNNEGAVITKFGEEPDEVKSIVQTNKVETVMYTGLFLNNNKKAGVVRDYYLIMVPVYLLDSDKVRDRKGVCVLIMDVSNYNVLLKRTSITPNAVFVITDTNGTIIADQDINYVGRQFDEIYSRFKENEVYLNRDYIRQTFVIKKSNWRIISIIPKSELLEELNIIRRFSFITCIISLIVLVIFIGLFLVNITNPINHLIKFMKSVPQKGIGNRLPAIYKNEFGMLGSNLNAMLDEIEKLNYQISSAQKRMFDLEISSKQIELAALYSQINPHFLYNTLECIRGIALAYNVKEIADISLSMSNLFRYSIKGQEMVQVQDEINSLENYITIIKTRFMGRFEISLDADEEILTCMALKMILQPVVENAIHHGLEEKISGGWVKVRIENLDYKKIRYQIVDNGIGIDKDKLEEITAKLRYAENDNSYMISDKRGIGLFNIYRRLRLHYGEEASLELESIKNERTCVIIEFPVRRSKDVQGAIGG